MKEIKCVVVGDGGVGKTCLILSFTQNSFPKDYVPTIFDTHTAKLEVEHTPINLNLWDTAGQEDYERTRPMAYLEANVFIVCFSLVELNSLENIINKWKSEINNYCPGVPLILCGTKSDLRDNWNNIPNDQKPTGAKPISREEGEKVAKQLNTKYVECSALEAKGIKEVFEAACLVVLNKTFYKKYYNY